MFPKLSIDFFAFKNWGLVFCRFILGLMVLIFCDLNIFEIIQILSEKYQRKKLIVLGVNTEQGPASSNGRASAFYSNDSAWRQINYQQIDGTSFVLVAIKGATSNSINSFLLIMMVTRPIMPYTGPKNGAYIQPDWAKGICCLKIGLLICRWSDTLLLNSTTNPEIL